MLNQSIVRKIQIVKQPLPALDFGQRCFLKSFLLCLEQLVTTENLNLTELNSDPLILAFNHNCSYEALLVPTYLIYLRRGRPVSFIVDWMYAHLPVVGWIIRQIDPVLVYNKYSTIKALNKYRAPARSVNIYDQCVQRLANGKSIGIFPEGTRNPNPQSLLKGKKGIGYIALESGVPVLPIGIDFPSRRAKGRIPSFGPLILRAGNKLDFSDECSLYQQNKSNPASASTKKTADYLAGKVTFQVMPALAGLSGKQYPFPEPSPS